VFHAGAVETERAFRSGYKMNIPLNNVSAAPAHIIQAGISFRMTNAQITLIGEIISRIAFQLGI
jgi:hypothetical protein